MVMISLFGTHFGIGQNTYGSERRKNSQHPHQCTALVRGRQKIVGRYFLLQNMKVIGSFSAGRFCVAKISTRLLPWRAPRIEITASREVYYPLRAGIAMGLG
jgi:hypothetical protein